jgi:hypothetical protein
MLDIMSMGLRLKANYKRHFFNSIVIYDLGTEPNSVNIYYFYRPVITTIDHAGLDIEDRSSKVEITMNFEYENYYFAVGRNRMEVADAVELLTGIRPPDDITNNFFPNNHGAMRDIPSNSAIPVSKASPNPMTPLPDTDPIPVPAPGELPVDPYGEPKEVRPPGEIQSEIDIIRGELSELSSGASSTGGDDVATEFDRARLSGKLKKLRKELNESAAIASAKQKAEQSAPATKSAVENTQKQIDAEEEKTKAVIKNPANAIFDGKDSSQWRDNAKKSLQQAEHLLEKRDVVDGQINLNNSGIVSLPDDKMKSLLAESDRLTERVLESVSESERSNDIADKLDNAAQVPLT